MPVDYIHLAFMMELLDFLDKQLSDSVFCLKLKEKCFNLVKQLVKLLNISSNKENNGKYTIIYIRKGFRVDLIHLDKK